MSLRRRLLAAAERWGLTSVVARGAGVAFALQVSGVAVAYLLHVALARWLGAGDYGAYTYVLAWATTLAIFTTLGLDAAALRFTAEYAAAGRWRLLRGLLSSFWWLAAGVSVAVAALAMALVAWRGGSALLVLGMVLVPLLTLLSLQSEMARGFGAIALSQAPQRLLRPALLLAAVAAVAWTSGGLTARGALLLTLAAFAAVVAAQGVALLRRRPAALAGAEPERRLGDWLRTALPLLFSRGFTILLAQIDLLMIGLLRTDAEVGRYNAAVKTATLVTFVIYAINVAAAPRFAALHAQGKRAQLQSLASKVAHWAFWPSLALTALLALLAVPILRLFGDAFAGAAWELRILALGHLFGAGIGSVGYLLNQTGFERANARAVAVSTLIAVLLNALLIPRFGTLGAAWATTVTWVIFLLLLCAAVRRKLGIRPSILAHLGRRPDRRG